MKVRIAAILLGFFAMLVAPLVAGAHQSGQSLADAARKVREQQKTAPKAKMVWTNDNVPTAGTVSVVGQAAPQGAAAGPVAAPANAPSGEETGAAEKSGSRISQLESEVADAKKALESVKTDLDLAQREYKLDSDQHYSMPNYAADQQGAAKLAAGQKQISAKQAEVDAAQKKVDELQKQLDAAKAKLKGAEAKPGAPQS